MNEVAFYDADLHLEKWCPLIDFLWDSRLFEVGEYQVQVLTEDELLDFDTLRFVMVKGKKEVGIIQRWEYSSERKNTCIISGYFLERALYEQVVYPTYDSGAGKKVWQIAQEVCEDYLQNLNWLNIGNLPTADGGAVETVESFQQTGDTVGDLLYGICQPHGYIVEMTSSFLSNDTICGEIVCGENTIIHYDPIKERIIDIQINAPVDRTGEGAADEIVLSTGWNNIKSYDAITDRSGVLNYAIVAGEGEGSARKFVVVDLREDTATDPIHELWVDARDLQQDEGMSDSTYIYNLQQRGLEKLAEHQQINSIEIELTQEEAEKVGTSYGLGDLISVAIPPLSIYAHMQVTEIEDVMNQGKRTTTVSLDNLGTAGWQKVKRYYR